jgi:hypothetical protein
MVETILTTFTVTTLAVALTILTAILVIVFEEISDSL